MDIEATNTPDETDKPDFVYPRVRIASIVSSAGDLVPLPAAGVTCVVGANNVGKSRLLRDVSTFLEAGPGVLMPTISDVLLDRTEITLYDAAAFLEANGVRSEHRNQLGKFDYMPSNGGQHLSDQSFFQTYANQSRWLGITAGFFRWHSSAGQQSGFVMGPVGGLGQTLLSTPHPLVKVYRDSKLERELSELALRAFGLPLTLDRLPGSLQLRVGRPDVDVPRFDEMTPEYIDAIRALDPLSEQGDGIKSFMGLALQVLASTVQILIIDEPESFLHPAQARFLGRWLAGAAKKADRQVIVATHDRDFVLGLMSADTPITLCRVSRVAEGQTHIHMLAPETVAETWNKPVLRYSNVLQGLFHQRAVITEADSDCRFYNAVLEGLVASDADEFRVTDVLFVPAGGKKGVPALAAALSSLDVETWAIVDFDVLRDSRDAKAIVAAMGGDWTTACSEPAKAFYNFANCLAGADATFWDTVKEFGLDRLTGKALTSAKALLAAMAAERVLVVPVGEIEGFQREITEKKAAWVSEALSLSVYKDQGPRDFLKPLAPDIEEPVSGKPSGDTKLDATAS